MALYYMDTKTMLGIFLKEDPLKLKKAQYIIVSTRIRKADDSITIAATVSDLYPSEECFMAYDGCSGYIDKKAFRESYEKQLKEYDAFFATIILGVIEYKHTMFFICSKNEMKLGYLELIAEYIEKRFGFPVYCYKKIKEGKETSVTYDVGKVVSTCQKILKKARKAKIKDMCKTEHGRMKYVKSMSKSEMKKLLKKMQLYAPGLSKQEMQELLEEFFIYQ